MGTIIVLDLSILTLASFGASIILGEGVSAVVFSTGGISILLLYDVEYSDFLALKAV